jgi:hypothetical protein
MLGDERRRKWLLDVDDGDDPAMHSSREGHQHVQ